MNAVTAFLDLSAIYGSALNETEFLRSGKLKVFNRTRKIPQKQPSEGLNNTCIAVKSVQKQCMSIRLLAPSSAPRYGFSLTVDHTHRMWPYTLV